MRKNKPIYAAIAMVLLFTTVQAQDEDLLKAVQDSVPQKQYVSSAFKSSRVINGHSIEMIGKRVLDVRILHRFGLVSNGAKEFFGLDQASTRIGFDYGILTNLTVGIGRSSLNKEFDGFVKWRILRQSTGEHNMPFSLVWVSGMTVFTLDFADQERKNYFSSRVGYYHEVIIGRKFSERFSLQLSPLFVHRNLVEGADEDNDTYALGIGGRFKLSKRFALVMDYHPILAGRKPGTYDPVSVGVDIETGGHVFQLHFTNSAGMNEKEFITNTTDDFWKGDIRFGFNLSRVFTLGGKKKQM